MLVLYSTLTLSQSAFSIYPSPPRRPDDPQPAPLRLGTFNLGLGLTHKLPRIVARCAELELDIIALQEVGDPALLCNRFPPYQLIYAAGPSHHQAGVGLLLLSRLAPSVRRYLRSPSGRLAGAVLELTHGHQLLLVSAYMPSGIDHQPPSSEAHHTARSLYAELLGWTAGMQQVIVLGDLNETLTRWDRYPLPAPRLIGGAAAVAADSPLHTLVAEGYTDVYRHLHPHAAASPGFTHFLDGARPSRSRIDYIWSKGVAAASLLHCVVDASLHSLSHHRLLWAELRLQHAPAATCNTPLHQLKLPNLRAATEEHKTAFVQRVESSLAARRNEFDSLILHPTPDSLQCLATSLTQLVQRAAERSFPMTGAAPLRSACILQLQQQRRCLSGLISIAERVLSSASSHGSIPGDCLQRNPEWCRQLRSCQKQHPSLRWRSSPWHGEDPLAWIQETHALLNHTRSAIRKEQRRMQRVPPMFFFFLNVMAMIFHKTMQQKLQGLSHAASCNKQAERVWNAAKEPTGQDACGARVKRHPREQEDRKMQKKMMQ